MKLDYLKSQYFPIHLLCYWWILWLSISYSGLSDFQPPTPATMVQYVVLLASFVAGHLAIRYRKSLKLVRAGKSPPAFHPSSTRIKLVVYVSALGSALMLLISLYLANAFSSGFIEYFARLRMNDADLTTLTGVHSLDVLTKVLAFPLSYTVILITLANEIRHFKFALIVCIFNLLCFSYLWQVNYPLIHLFWFLVFYMLIRSNRTGRIERRPLFIVFAVFAVLLVSAANRFGGDVVGGFQRYIVGYHLVGFSFYDYQYHDPDSVLHSPSFGRSTLGFLDQIVETTAKVAGFDYQAASSQNSNYNDQAVDIGLREVRPVNAFGTLLFSFYRDFNLMGVVIGGLIYGGAVTYALCRSGWSWVYGALFLLLASAWMMGMMVSPVEQAYFWLAIAFLASIAVVNRGVRWRSAN